MPCECCESGNGTVVPQAENRELHWIIAGAALFVLSFLARRFVPPSAAAFLPWRPETMLFAVTLAVSGGTVFWTALKHIGKGVLFDETFLMSAAAAAAFCIGEEAEAVAVMLFYRVGEYFQNYAVGKSRRSIAALSSLRGDRARVLQGHDHNACDGGVSGEGGFASFPRKTVGAQTVNVGDYLEVWSGERVPLDGVVVSGHSFLDTSALTGESVPREAFEGSEVLAGCNNSGSPLILRVTKVSSDSAIERILRLVEDAADKKAVTQRFITRFAVVYTPVVTAAAFLLAIAPPLFLGADWSEWIRRGVILLVVSCPCALVISVPLGFFGGIGAASRAGILVKGSNYLELLAAAETVVFDKTGTMTRGVFEVQAVHSAFPGGDEGGRLLAVAAHAESASTHPIASSLQAAHRLGKPDCPLCGSGNIADLREVAGKGVSVTVNGTAVLAGTLDLLRGEGVVLHGEGGASLHGEGGNLCAHCSLSPEDCARNDGGTVVHVSEGGRYSGHIVIADELKADAARAVAALKAVGVKKTVMLTGDSKSAGEKAARDLGVDEVYCELLPADKVLQVERLLAAPGRKGSLVFVGDGINDAPVLARSDVGFAMGGMGSDAAVEAADAVIMSDEPSRLAVGIEIARRTMTVVRQNILFSLGIKAGVLLMGAAGLGNLWFAVFADVGVTFLAVLNSLRLLGADRQSAPGSPACGK